MKRILFAILFFGLVTAGCEKREFYFTSGFSEAGNYTVNQTGPFSRTATFSLDETLDALELPEDASIDSVYIKSISIKGQVLGGNQATGVNITGTLTYNNVTRTLFNANHIAISGNNIIELGLTDLNPAAISLIKKFMTARVRTFFGLPIHGFPLQNSFTITLNGSPTPLPSATINLSLDLKVAFDLSYYTCIDAPPIIGGDCPVL